MSIAQQDSDSYRGCGENMFLKIYSSTDAHINAVISHLFYRTFVKMLPDYQIGSKPIKSIEHLLRNWTGGRHSRILKQPIVYTGDMDLKPDPELCLKDVLEVLDWLFEEVQMSPDKNPYATNVCFLCRIQCVNAAQIARGFKNTKHRPYDMLLAIFANACCMNGSQEEHEKLKQYFKKFAKMYLFQCKIFDYRPQDFYQDVVDTLEPSAQPIETIYYLFRRVLLQFSTRQEYVLSSIQLTLHDVIVVLHRLFEEHGSLNIFRLESVDTVKQKSLHRPLDMLCAIISSAHFLPKTESNDDEMNLQKYFHQIAPIYLLESSNFDYVKKDIYSHE